MLTKKDREYLTKLLEHINNSLQLDVYNLESNIYMSDSHKAKKIREKNLNIKSRQNLIDRLNMVELEAELGTNYNKESMFKVDESHIAPYSDWNGKTLHEGAVIIHPSGEEGTIFYDKTKNDENDCWWVAYESGPGRLVLQIGERGQAVLKE